MFYTFAENNKQLTISQDVTFFYKTLRRQNVFISQAIDLLVSYTKLKQPTYGMFSIYS